MNTDCFQTVLNGFSERYPSDFHVVQVDNTRFHRSKALVMPDNVMLLYQPPYSPQVNSAERLWQWSKNEITHEIFPNLEILKVKLRILFLSKPSAFFSSLTRRAFIFNVLQKIGMVPENI